ncbi:hypothetical protein WDW86_07465 [Bdellovibrionota bacterium FG-2]
MFKTQNKVKVLILAIALTGMGIAMPSCPGQQALQQQVDKLTTQNADTTKRIQALDEHVKTLNGEMAQAKQLLLQITNVIQAQKTTIEQLEASMKSSPAKGKGAKAAAAKTAPKKKGK